VATVQAALPGVAAEASVVLVRSRLGGARLYQGSGVVVAPGLVATNAHVVRGGQGVTVHQGGTAWLATELRSDPFLDLCLLAVPGLTAPPALPAPEPEGPGQAVVAVGYPGGRMLATHGHLRGVWHDGKGRLLQSDAPTLPGSSGGGLFDGQGRLLGLTTLTFTTSPRLNFSVPWAWIETFAAAEEPATPGPRPALAVDLMERLAADPRNAPMWERAARQWVRDLPGDAQAWLALGLALDQAVRVAAEAGQAPSRSLLQEAAVAYRRSLDLQADPKVWNDLGVVLDLLDEADGAEGAFRAALALEPRYALAWLNLGCARMNARQFEGACEALEQGLALRPDDAGAWGRLAACQRMLGRREAAAASLERLLRYRPLARDLWLEYGTLLAELGRWEGVQQVEARLGEWDPDLAARLKAAAARFRSDRSRAAAASGRRGR